MELLDRIRSHADIAPRHIAYHDAATDRSITYAELVDAIISRQARYTEGSRRVILVRADVGVDFAIDFLAAISVGVDVLPLSAGTTPSEIEALARRCNASANHASWAAAFLASGSVSTAVPAEASRRGTLQPLAGWLLLTTSGSTGRVKIVRRCAASLDAVAANTVESVGFTSADRVLATVPLAHSYGLEHGLLAPMWAGATVLLCDGLQLPQLAAAIASGVTIFPAVPSILERLADASEPFDNLRNVRTIYSAGAPLPDAVGNRFTRRFGTPIGQLYGSTEIGTVTYRHGDAHSGVGLPMRGVSIRILDGDAVAIRSPSMFDGYLDEPAELVDGHFLTGDLGHLAADGSLVLTGRSKLLIDTGGLKVNPLEVEAVLRGHADVADVIVVPLRQSETVCRLRAIVVPRDPASPPSAEALRAFARERLAPHKVPRAFTFRDSLPRSATGKVLRRMLDRG